KWAPAGREESASRSIFAPWRKALCPKSTPRMLSMAVGQRPLRSRINERHEQRDGGLQSGTLRLLSVPLAGIRGRRRARGGFWFPADFGPHAGAGVLDRTKDKRFTARTVRMISQSNLSD